jgi:TRAP-type transport system periplasmic protein
MKGKWILLLAAVLLVIASAGSVFAQGAAAGEEKTLTLKFGHQISEKSAEGIAAQAFADKVAEKSGGSIEIVVFPGEQLGSAPVLLESVMIGTLDLAMVAGQFLGSYEPTMSMVNTPYFFKDPAAYREVLRSTGLGDRQVENLHDSGFTVVNTDRNFFRGDRLIASVKPIRGIDDFKGLRFRAFENDIYVTSYTKLGANVLVVPWGETYSALRQGTVESSCASIDQLYSTGFAEVCPYITWTKEYYTEVLMVANNDLWDKMSADQQRILTEAANEAGLVMEQEVAKSTRNDVERIEKEFNAEFITIDTTPLRDALIPYYYELESKGVIPAGVVDSILAQK